MTTINKTTKKLRKQGKNKKPHFMKTNGVYVMKNYFPSIELQLCFIRAHISPFKRHIRKNEEKIAKTDAKMPQVKKNFDLESQKPV